MSSRKHPAIGTLKDGHFRSNVFIHVSLLAKAYVNFVQSLPAAAGFSKINPSGYIESQGSFAKRVAREVRTRVAWPCEVELEPQQDFSEPLLRTNLEPAAEMIPGWSEKAAWDAFVEFYNR